MIDGASLAFTSLKASDKLSKYSESLVFNQIRHCRPFKFEAKFYLQIFVS